MFCVDKLG